MKTVNLNLVGVDGNAFSVMGAFSKQAKKEKWSKEEIDTVLQEAMSGDYNHLLTTISNHCSTDESSFENDY
jgi:hypothetical protein